MTKQDKIPAKLLMSIRHFISSPVNDIINEKISQTIFPDFLNLAVITPIHKKTSNYQPCKLQTDFCLTSFK